MAHALRCVLGLTAVLTLAAGCCSAVPCASPTTSAATPALPSGVVASVRPEMASPPALSAAVRSGPSPIAQILLDVQTVRVPASKIEALLAELKITTPSTPTVWSRAQVARYVKRVGSDRDLTVLQSPKMLALDGQDATVFIGETVRFAKSVGTDGNFTIEEHPEGPVFLGYTVRATPHWDAALRQIDIEYSSSERKLIDEDALAKGANTDRAVFLRDATVAYTQQAHLRLESGASVLVGASEVLEDADGKHVRLTRITARVVDYPVDPRSADD